MAELIETAPKHTHSRSPKFRLTPEQQQQESALVRAILLDFVMYVSLVVAAIASNSLTMLAELPRATLLYSMEIVAWIMLRRTHRGKMVMFEYGTGKIERAIMLIIAGGLILTALWTLDATAERLDHPTVLPTPALILAVIVSSANLLVNAYCVVDFIRAASCKHSLIIESQVRSRMVKTAASAVVVVVLVFTTWIADPKAAAYVDAFGAIFVIGYMVIMAINMFRESLPDLLDRALPEEEQLAVMRVLARNFDDFDRFCRLRTRRSAERAYVDLHLYFDGDLTLQDAVGRCDAIARDIKAAIPGTVVRVKPHAKVAT